MMLTGKDFDNLVLTFADLRVLRKIKKVGKLRVEDKAIWRHLSSSKLAQGEYLGMEGDFPCHSNELSLTDNGKLYFAYRKQRLLRLLFRSILVPIFVAALTTLITLGLRGLFQ